MTNVVDELVTSPTQLLPPLSRSQSMERLSPGRRCSSESDSPSRSRSRSNSPPAKSRWSRRRSPSPPPVDSFPQFTARSSAAPASPILDDKVLFMFFRYSISSPFGYCLVRVSQSDLSSSAYSEIKPVIQFPVKEFPLLMRCIELDSKLYFLGGEMAPFVCKVPNPKYPEYFPPQVYVVDADTLASAGNTITDPHQVLKIGPPMNSGKPDPYVFQACGKIYVMAGDELLPCYSDDEDEEFLEESFDIFEVYEPERGWSVLPDPPLDESLTGHAVVDRQVIVVTRYPRIFFFNVDTHAWKKLSASIPSPIRFETKAEFVDGALYSSCDDYATLVAYCKGDDEAKGPFDHLAFMSDQTRDDYGEEAVFNSSSCLVHLGDRTFCHVIGGDSALPFDEPGVTSYHKLGIILAFLETGEIYKDTTNEHILPAKVLQSSRLVSPTTIGKEPLLRDCFAVSSRRTVTVI